MSVDLVGSVFLGLCIFGGLLLLSVVLLHKSRPEYLSGFLRLFFIALFTGGFAVASEAIGVVVNQRHEQTYGANARSAQTIWGGSIEQAPPSFSYVERSRLWTRNAATNKEELIERKELRPLGLNAQRLAISLRKNIREKGLVKLPGYDLTFNGEYIFENHKKQADQFELHLALPNNAGNITGIAVTLDQKPYTEDVNTADGIDWAGSLAAGESHTLRVSYQAQGMNSFSYSAGQRGVAVDELRATMTTDFADYRLPDGAMAFTREGGDQSGAKLEWEAQNLVTGQNIALAVEAPGNYGAQVGKLFVLSPIAIVLFMATVFLYSLGTGAALHPMHYLFFGAGFLSFHLLAAYLIGALPLAAALPACLAVSTALTVYYAVLLKRGRGLVSTIAMSLVAFQWVYSLAFFVPGYTGLFITLTVVLTLGALMKVTAGVDWDEKLRMASGSVPSRS